MSRRLVVTAIGFPCKLKDCPPGLFVKGEDLCLKTEYAEDEAYCYSGEVFWGGAKKGQEVKNVIVQPCEYEWEGDNE